jgi:hydroxymethylglutaryl-CoA lyase
MDKVKVIECPRDAMQGIEKFIETSKKIEYINSILQVGFDSVDFGSFVSPKAIPQLADTRKVLENLDLSKTKSELLAIVANGRGAEDACSHRAIKYIGFPFSISETFQQRNTNSSISESLKRVEAIQNLCIKNDKVLVVYISMAFGNPYGDIWNSDIAIKWAEKLVSDFSISIIALSDTIGTSNPESIKSIFVPLIRALPNTEFGAHLHTTPTAWKEKLDAAYQAGCRRFDGAIKGYGGCPMASDKLTGNMPTEKILEYFKLIGVENKCNEVAFEKAFNNASKIFDH